MFLGTKRLVALDGRTSPFLDWNEYEKFIDKNLVMHDKKFIYI